MLRIGIAQIINSTEVEANFAAIENFLTQFEKRKVDLILFPECSLSGFSSKMRDCTALVLSPYLDRIQAWCHSTGIEVIIPTAIVIDNKIYDSGFWFKADHSIPFYKIGLTESEKGFFSVPSEPSQKVFQIKEFNLALIICHEIEKAPWSYFKRTEADLILWPGYWGWRLEEEWSAHDSKGKENTIFSNIKEWSLPIIQSNFAMNDPVNMSAHSGPEGASHVIDGNNTVMYKGPLKKVGGFIVTVKKQDQKASIVSCEDLN